MPPSRHASLIGSTPVGVHLRDLTTERMMRLVDYFHQIASRASERSSGLSDFEWRILALVCESPRLSNNRIAVTVHRDVAQVSRTVTKLMAAGLVHRTSRPGGPGVRITATNLGRRVYRQLKMLARQRDSSMILGMDTGDLQNFHRYIDIMTVNALAQLAKGRRKGAGSRVVAKDLQG